MSSDEFAFVVPLDLDAIRSRYRQAVNTATPGRMSVALLASAADVPVLLSEVDRLSALLFDARLEHANLRAAARAALSAARDGEPDPFVYLRRGVRRVADAPATTGGGVERPIPPAAAPPWSAYRPVVSGPGHRGRPRVDPRPGRPAALAVPVGAGPGGRLGWARGRRDLGACRAPGVGGRYRRDGCRLCCRPWLTVVRWAGAMVVGARPPRRTAVRRLVDATERPVARCRDPMGPRGPPAPHGRAGGHRGARRAVVGASSAPCPDASRADHRGVAAVRGRHRTARLTGGLRDGGTGGAGRPGWRCAGARPRGMWSTRSRRAPRQETRPGRGTSAGTGGR
jgi:hypothetical protein